MKRIAKTVSALGVALLSAGHAFAQQGAFFSTQSATGIAATAAAQGSLGENVTRLINYFLGFLGLVAVAFVIYGGILMVTSGGNEEGVGKAKKIITYAAIGIVIIVLSYTIVTFVTSALG